jgi:hypothetical protein
VENPTSALHFEFPQKWKKAYHRNLNSSTAKKCIPKEKTKLSREESYLWVIVQSGCINLDVSEKFESFQHFFALVPF